MGMNPGQEYDVVVVGGGHNGLAAAAYVARAGYSVAVLESQPWVGGAAISAQSFDGVEAKLSRYSYLVSLMPQHIRDDLGLDISLIRRRYSSYTPLPGKDLGLLIDSMDSQRTRESFEAIGAGDDYERWVEFYRDTEIVASTLFPTMTQPLLREHEIRTLLDKAAPGRGLFERFIDTPIIRLVEDTFTHDVVRGVVLTDSLIGTFPETDSDPALNACFLYHVIGGGTGDWDVPVGGMGAVSAALEKSARDAGVTISTSSRVTLIVPNSHVEYVCNGVESRVNARLVIAGVSRDTLHRLAQLPTPAVKPEGAQVKVNLMLTRLPRLADTSVTPEEAFGGTFHINESASQLASSLAQARSGQIPDVIPCEIYCHTLSDRSILGSELQAGPAQTLTVFALNVPHSLIADRDPESARSELESRVLASLNSVLDEPIEDCMMRDSHGQVCIETKTTLDLENTVGLPGGNIFHEPLEMPFPPDHAPLHSPAQRWGVSSSIPGALIAGSSSRRGGGVSAIGGHNAAMAALEILGSDASR